MKFGHRGANQPAKDLATGRVYVTSQNHGYAVDNASLDGSGAVMRFVNVTTAPARASTTPASAPFRCSSTPRRTGDRSTAAACSPDS